MDGKENLTPKQQEKLSIGSATFQFSLKIISACLKYGVPVMIENPASSLMWSSPRFARLLDIRSCTKVIFEQCQFGTPWRKSTKVCGWGTGELFELNRRCHATGGKCSRTNKPHIVLSGTAPGGKNWTAIAAAYPDLMAAAVASIFIRVAEGKQSIHLHSRMGG